MPCSRKYPISTAAIAGKYEFEMMSGIATTTSLAGDKFDFRRLIMHRLEGDIETVHHRIPDGPI
jgi:hypothetical protein